MSESWEDDERGAIARALLWVVGAFGLSVLVFVAVSPELIGNEPRVAFELVGVVSLAAVPGLVLLVLAAVRRKRLGLDDPPVEHGGAPTEGDRTTDRTDGKR